MLTNLGSIRKPGEMIIGYKVGEDYLANPGNILIIGIDRTGNRNTGARLYVSGAYQFREYGSPNEIALFQQEEETRRLEEIVKGIVARQPHPLHITRRDNECLIACRHGDDIQTNPDNIALLIAGQNKGKLGLYLWGDDYEFVRTELLNEDNPQQKNIVDAMLDRVREMGFGRRIRF